MTKRGPTPDFFEGMLLGNGDVGLCVTVRPDALGLHLGKEDSWDLRVSEDHYKHTLHFKDLLKLWERASAEAKRQGKPEMLFLERNIDFFREYTDKVGSSYRKVWPRPWPCGIVWIHWDSRMVEVGRQSLDIGNGLLTIDLDYDNLRGARRSVRVNCFVNYDDGHVAVWTDTEAPFLSLAYYPNIDPQAQLPAVELEVRQKAGFGEFTSYQHFPATAPTPEVPNPPRGEKDSNFFLVGRVHGDWLAEEPARDRAFLRSGKSQAFRLDLVIATPRDNAQNRSYCLESVGRYSAKPAAQIQRASEQSWRKFWSKSAVELADKELERIWYHNQYFLACCLKPGKISPGLFGNWTSGRIGTAWHGDYHMNYNTQQVFWGVFSSNHVEQNLPYVDLVEKLFDYSKNYAREKFGLPGAFYPHTAYPVPSQTIPYPVPPWGYEICETPWTAQGLWWHYLYTLDKDYLKRVYPMIRAATEFLVAYMNRGDDGKYHIIPTVSPENWGFTVDFRLNKDCIIDLALTEFILDATLQASQVLGVDADLRARWKEVRANIAPYPKAKGPFGEVWLDVVDGPVEYVFNVPITMAPVFPGEQVGIGLGEPHREIAERTVRTARLEGGNDLVYQPLIRARMGLLDMDWFKKEVRYCLLPNGTCFDRTRQIGGRYRDSTHPDYMGRMGIWIENLSLPAVLNESMMQSYSGTIRLFPNTKGLGPARFHNMRAAGAFLVSAAYDGQKVTAATIRSEKGAPCKLASPWGAAAMKVIRADNGKTITATRAKDAIAFPTEPGASYRVEPA